MFINFELIIELGNSECLVLEKDSWRINFFLLQRETLLPKRIFE
jgi:hypothetical protein